MTDKYYMRKSFSHIYFCPDHYTEIKNYDLALKLEMLRVSSVRSSEQNMVFPKEEIFICTILKHIFIELMAIVRGNVSGLRRILRNE